jgi:hypothetical protein
MFMWLSLSDADAGTKIAGSLRGYGAIEMHRPGGDEKIEE